MWGAILGLVSAALGYIFNSKQAADAHNAQQRNIQQSLNAQKEENEKTREYNLMLAEKQNAWNVEQWERENAYNDPAAQMERMRNAGLNPDMMYGGGVSGNLAASSPSMTSGAAANPMDWSALAGRKFFQANPADATKEFLQNRMLEAQIKNIEADTDNKDVNTNILESDLAFRDAWNSRNIQLQDLDIQLKGDAHEINLISAEKLRKEVEQVSVVTESFRQNIFVAQSQVRNYDADTALKHVQRICHDKLTDAQVKELAAKHDLEVASAFKIVAELPYFLTNLQSQSNLNDANAALAKSQNGLTLTQGAYLRLQGDKLTLDIEEQSNHPRHLGGMWTHIYRGIDFANDVVGLVSPILGAAPTRVSHNTTQYVVP